MDTQRPTCACRKSRCSTCKKAKDLKARMLKNKMEAAFLKKKLRKLNKVWNRKHDPFILRLPVEVASRVFEHCLELVVEDIFFAADWELWYNHLGLTPSEIASVCKGWRAIALSTPQLWTRVRVTLKYPCSEYEEFLRDLLSRSGSLPLSFILADADIAPAERGHLLNLFTHLKEHCTRWNVVHLRISPFLMPDLFCENANVSDLIIVKPRNDRTEAWDFGPVDTIYNWKNVRLKLGNTTPRRVYVEHSFLDFIRLPISWSNATVVELGTVYLDEFFELLSNTPRLKDLTITVLSQESDNDDTTKVLNPSLKQLKIRSGLECVENETIPSVSDVFSILTLPKLEYLTLRSFQSELQSLSAFVSRSSCDLQMLFVENCEGTLAATMAELRHIPSILDLRLDRSVIGMDGIRGFLEELTNTRGYRENWAPPGSAVLPKLHTLQMSVWNTPVDWSLVPKLFPPEQRMMGLEYRPLRKVGIRMLRSFNEQEEDDRFIPKTTLGEMQKLIDRGNELSIYNSKADTCWMEASRLHHTDMRCS